MKHQRINHLAVWLCVIMFQALSILWYSPVLFADKWMGYLGKTFNDFKGESFTGLVFSVAGAIAFSYFLAWLFIRLRIDNGVKGLFIAIAVALCCFVFTTFTQDSFSLRSPGLSLINTGIILCNYCMAGVLLGSWKKYRVAQN